MFFRIIVLRQMRCWPCLEHKPPCVRNSPNSCLPTWGPSFESYVLVVVRQLWRILTTSFLSHVLANIHILDLTISKCCCGSRKSTKSLLSELFPWVSSFKMLLWATRGSIFRCMQQYLHHCYHQHPTKTTRISINIEVRLFSSCVAICIFIQTRR